MWRFRLITLFVLICSAELASAQNNRFVVFFKDKNASPYSTTKPEEYLSSRAITRRIKQSIPVTIQDLPVNPAYVQQLRDAGIKVYYSSKWMNCVLIQSTDAAAFSLSALSSVDSVARVAYGSRLPARMKTSKATKKANGAEATKAQLHMLGIDEMQADNLLGTNVHIAIMDSGFPGVDDTEPFYHLVRDNKILSTHDFVWNTKNVYRYDDHGTEVLSVIGANSDTYTGGAYDASFHLYVTEDVPTEYPIEEYNFLFATERADSAGVDIIHTSLGYNRFESPFSSYNRETDIDGKKAVISKAAQYALDKGIVVVVSAGNEGNMSWSYVTPPADVDGVIAVGSVNLVGTRSAFSSKGPTSDGRIKPDVVALGSSVSVVRLTGDNGLTTGTSLSAPIVTSLVAGLLQAFPDVDPNDISETLIRTSSQALTPDNLLGYGIPHYRSARTKLEGIESQEEISISPNPTDTGTFNVYFRTPGVKASIVIYDIAGRELGSHDVDVTSTNNPVIIDVASLPASSYLVKVKTSDNFKTFRIVKL